MKLNSRVDPNDIYRSYLVVYFIGFYQVRLTKSSLFEIGITIPDVFNNPLVPKGSPFDE